MIIFMYIYTHTCIYMCVCVCVGMCVCTLSADATICALQGWREAVTKIDSPLFRHLVNDPNCYLRCFSTYIHIYRYLSRVKGTG